MKASTAPDLQEVLRKQDRLSADINPFFYSLLLGNDYIHDGCSMIFMFWIRSLEDPFLNEMIPDLQSKEANITCAKYVNETQFIQSINIQVFLGKTWLF